MVGVTAEPEARADQIACAQPKLSLVVPLILLFDLLTCCCCLWALLVSVAWMQIH
jgi:hypothetical protein